MARRSSGVAIVAGVGAYVPRTRPEWLTAVLAHLDRQRHHAVELLRDALPAVVATPPAATYLLWLDCRALGFGDDPSEEFLRRGVRVNEGPEFGPCGVGHTRLNFATSSAVMVRSGRGTGGGWPGVRGGGGVPGGCWNGRHATLSEVVVRVSRTRSGLPPSSRRDRRASCRERVSSPV